MLERGNNFGKHLLGASLLWLISCAITKSPLEHTAQQAAIDGSQWSNDNTFARDKWPLWKGLNASESVFGFEVTRIFKACEYKAELQMLDYGSTNKDYGHKKTSPIVRNSSGHEQIFCKGQHSPDNWSIKLIFLLF
jgi:hypothetical protein